MINPSQIKKKALRKYKEFLQAEVEDKNFFPLEFAIGNTSRDYIQLRDELNQLRENSKSKIDYGYTVELVTKNTQKLGKQSLPQKVSIETEIDYLRFLNRQIEFKKFQANIELIRSLVPQLEQWLLQNPIKVIDHADKWSDLLKVCRYFQNNHQPNLYLRELPIAVHTKFIEENKSILDLLLEVILPPEVIQTVDKKKKHTFEQKFSLRYEEPPVRFKVLDEQVKLKYHFPIFDLTTPLSEFEQIDLQHHNCFITENKMNFLTLPSLANSFAIWGGGYRTTMLKSVSWLSSCSIFYWGDIDIDGFKILSQFRRYFPLTVSVMMNEDTFKTFEEFSVEVKQSEPEKLSNLTEEEYYLYSFVSEQGKRLEQEHISQDFTIECLTRYLTLTNPKINYD